MCQMDYSVDGFAELPEVIVFSGLRPLANHERGE